MRHSTRSRAVARLAALGCLSNGIDQSSNATGEDSRRYREHVYASPSAIRFPCHVALGMSMTRSNDPTQIDHAELREFAVQAVWVAKLEDAVGVLEVLVVDLVDEEHRSELEPWDEDPLEVALSVVHGNFE